MKAMSQLVLPPGHFLSASGCAHLQALGVRYAKAHVCWARTIAAHPCCALAAAPHSVRARWHRTLMRGRMCNGAERLPVALEDGGLTLRAIFDAMRLRKLADERYERWIVVARHRREEMVLELQ